MTQYDQDCVRRLQDYKGLSHSDACRLVLLLKNAATLGDMIDAYMSETNPVVKTLIRSAVFPKLEM